LESLFCNVFVLAIIFIYLVVQLYAFDHRVLRCRR
jgi:hypothetical protein